LGCGEATRENRCCDDPEQHSVRCQRPRPQGLQGELGVSASPGLQTER
jgi:hypothetical protein